jgi:hypothetical protein
MGRPKTTKFGWIKYIKEIHFGFILLALLLFYSFLNILFAWFYQICGTLDCNPQFFKYVYFSFITSFTIGYGDYIPNNDAGRLLVIVHVTLTSISFALIIAILSIKFFYIKDPIQYSKSIYFDSELNDFGFRVINTNKERIINPEIRISFTEHCIGNVIAQTFMIRKIDNLPYLGKHDFSFSINNKLKIENHWQQALEFDNNTEGPESRFQIVVTITGHNGIQHIASLKKYYWNNIEYGKHFKPIDYNKEDQVKWRNINYRKFKNFWKDFDSIIE